jgi:hypothetical protein
VKERPIIFGDWAIPKLLDGSKVQTRRPVKLPEGEWVSIANIEDDEPSDKWQIESPKLRYGRVIDRIKCPFGIVGDRLWCREAWCQAGTGQVFYRADGNELAEHVRWFPSIHMPREASRVTLELTQVRVERVQDIGEEDAEAEGVSPMLLGYAGCSADYMTDIVSYREGFADLWGSIYGPDAWARNDWCWCLSFRRVTEEQKSAA